MLLPVCLPALQGVSGCCLLLIEICVSVDINSLKPQRARICRSGAALIHLDLKGFIKTAASAFLVPVALLNWCLLVHLMFAVSGSSE